MACNQSDPHAEGEAQQSKLINAGEDDSDDTQQRLKES